MTITSLARISPLTMWCSVFRFRVAEEELLLPDEQHDDYRWLTPDALLASDNVHANSRAYFLAEKRAGVPGL